MILLGHTDIEAMDFSSFDFILGLGFLKEEISCIAHKSLQDILSQKKYICLHPLYQSYEIGAEEGVVAMFAYALDLAYKLENPYFKDLDIGYLSAESNFSEEELEEIIGCVQNSERTLFILGRDLFLHQRKTNILALLNTLSPLKNISIFAPFQEICSPSFQEPRDIQEIGDYSGAMLYRSLVEGRQDCLLGSSLFAKVSHLSHEHFYCLGLESQETFEKIKVKFIEQKNMTGVIGLLHLSYSQPNQHNIYPFWRITTHEEQI